MNLSTWDKGTLERQNERLWIGTYRLARILALILWSVLHKLIVLKWVVWGSSVFGITYCYECMYDILFKDFTFLKEVFKILGHLIEIMEVGILLILKIQFNMFKLTKNLEHTRASNICASVFGCYTIWL